MSTTPDQTPRQSVADLAEARRVAIDGASRARSTAYDRANREFVEAIRPIIDSGEMTVADVAEAAGCGRIRLYQLLRQYPATTTEASA